MVLAPSSEMSPRREIRVHPARHASSAALLGLVESLWPVRFTPGAVPCGSALCTSPVASAEPALLLDLPSIEQAAPAQSTAIRFADDAAVPWPYRNRIVNAKLRLAANAASSPNEAVLASTLDGQPVWTLERNGHQRRHRWALPLPALAPDGDVHAAAAGERFLQVLALFQFAREAAGTLGEALPPPRAAFMVDDPNLHWPTYGFADYRAIAERAQREDYHVAFATIPLDAWYTHPGSAALFRTHRRRLSLLIHGNDHGRNELAQSRSDAERAALLRRALERIGRLEARSGLEVGRIMVPPHGACSEAMLACLAAQGFEAACLSAGSLRAHNADRAWTRTVGFAPSETVAGCSVLPRWALSQAREDVLLAAAYLGQPLILRAHHQDLERGLEVFDVAARFIHGLGAVRWSDVTTISRANYRWRVHEGAFHVRPLAPRVLIEVPPDCERVVVAPAPCAREVLDGAGRRHAGAADQAIDIAARPGDLLDLKPQAVAPEPPARPLPVHRTDARLILRRLLTEARDRLLVH